MTKSHSTTFVDSAGLADPDDSRSSCGVGLVMDLHGGVSHETVADGLELLGNLEHRGTTGAESNTGDGAGITLQISDSFFTAACDRPLPESYAVGSIFLPQDASMRRELKELTRETLAEYDLSVHSWRKVPTDNGDLGETALDSEPAVQQVFVTPDTEMETDAFDQRLYVARRAIENAAHDIDGSDRFYICSLDRETVVYKGLLTAAQLSEYYPDLHDERMCSTFAMVHARFSTNTLGAWHLAHPYRTIIHNGEFNTIQGNINWMRARENDLADESFGSELSTLKPIINDEEQSDTASVDNALELLLATGRDLPHALRMLIPEAWRSPSTGVDGMRRDWYDYHASLVEPWDGPALVAATDGERVGAVLDRNGLRPCRYDVLTDGTLIMASEVGALEDQHDASRIERRGRLQPGQLFLADPAEGRVVPDEEVFDSLVDEKYGEWVDREQLHLADLEAGSPREEVDDLRSQQAVYGYTHEIGRAHV